MSYKLATAYVDIQARTSGVMAALGQLKSALGGMLTGISNINPLVAAVAGVASMTFAVRQLMQESEDGALAVTRLNAILRATGNVAKLSSQEVIEFAAQLQKEGTFGDTSIISAANKLIQLGVVTKDTYKDILRLSTDVARAGFGSVEHAAMTLGRALSDPASGMRRLRSIGIAFTKAEQDKIKALMASNNLLAAQSEIIEKVRRSVGGLDAQWAKTPQGIWARAKNDLATIAQSLGDHIFPIIADLGQEMVAIVRPLAKIVGYVMDINQVLGGWPLKLLIIGAAAKAAFSAFGLIRGAVIANIAEITKMGMALRALWVGRMVPIMGGMLQMPSLLARIGLAWKALAAAITTGTLFTGWGAVLVAIGAILVAVVSLGVYLSRFPKVSEAWGRMLKAASVFFETMWTAADQLWRALGRIITVILEMHGDILGLRDLFNNGLVGAAVFALDTITHSILRTTAYITVLKSHLADVARLMLAIQTRDFFGMASAIGKLSTVNTDAVIEYQRLVTEMNKMSKANAITPDADGVAESMDAFDKTKSPLMGLQQAWKNVQESILSKASPEEKMANGIKNLEGINQDQLEAQQETNRLLAAGGAVA